MGVKSTVRLSRQEAIDKAVYLYVEVNKRKIAAQFHAMSDKELEVELMVMNDEARGGEGFENYSVYDDYDWEK